MRERQCVRCMQWLCCGFGTKRVSFLGIFREKAEDLEGGAY
jgi:hypothetical protein